MGDFEVMLMDNVLATLSKKVDDHTLQKINTKDIRASLFRGFTNELFYKLLKEKRVDLAPGFGSLILKKRKETDKKVWDKATKTMVPKRIRGYRVVYIPGDALKEFL